MMDSLRWIKWATELQALAQAGLWYSRDPYDIERFERVRDIAAGMMAEGTDLPLEKVRDLFCNESGYQTPKIETRAAIFEDGKILLVRENDGLWSLPGGWADIGLSVGENAVREVREEAGLEARAERLIAVLDHAKHNRPLNAHSVCKIFILCSALGGHFEPNIETTGSGFFAEDALPELSEGKNSAEQIKMCFDAARDPDWKVLFD